MIDGITINCIIRDWETWKHLVNIPFKVFTDIETGNIDTRTRGNKIITIHRGKWEYFDIVVKEVFNNITGTRIFHLIIKGSLHKNQFNNKNYLPFTYQLLQEQINHICKTLYIDPTQAQISCLEVGINLVTPFVVMPFVMNNIISYKGNPFNRYIKDSTGFCLGIHCTLTQYSIKIYDKGKQNNLPQNLMRFEKRFVKMQVLNKYGIKYLSDLQDRPKVKGLLKMLLEAWENVLIYDIELLKKIIVTNNLKKGVIDLLTNGQNSNYWERLKDSNVRKFNYQREKFKKLVTQNGNKWQQKVTELIQQEWNGLFKNCTNLPVGKKEILSVGEKAELYNLTIKIKGNNVQKRFCLNCGKDITHQKEDSQFCSAKYVGYEAAHLCRNTANNFKYKIDKLKRGGLLFDPMPYFTNKPGYNNQSLK